MGAFNPVAAIPFRSHSLNLHEFPTIIKLNAKTATYTFVGDKPLQNICGELNTAMATTESNHHRVWKLILLQKLIGTDG